MDTKHNLGNFESSSDTNLTPAELALELTASSAKLLSELRAYSQEELGRLPDKELTLVTENVRETWTIFTELADNLGIDLHTEEDESVEVLAESGVSCEICDADIPKARVEVIPGIRTCVRCTEDLEKPVPTPAVFITDTDAERYKKKYTKEVEEEELKGRARRAARNQDRRANAKSRKRTKKRKVKKVQLARKFSEPRRKRRRMPK